MITRPFAFVSAVCPPLFSTYFHYFWRTIGGQLGVPKSFKMSIHITGKLSRNKKKMWYTYEWGKGLGERKASGIFTYTKPDGLIQKNHNKEALALLETKKSQMTIEQQSIGTPFIPQHRFRDNFLDYYADFVENNKREGNRHLQGSLAQFRLFVRKANLAPFEVTENYCARFRAFLLDRFTGKTPADYFGAFKRVVKNATKEGYYRLNPSEDTEAKRNPCKKEKEFLEADEYIKLIQTPIINPEIRDAFIFSCYTGLRWCDVEELLWEQIDGDKLMTTIVQVKTGKPVVLNLHPIAQTILKNKRAKLPPQVSKQKQQTRTRILSCQRVTAPINH